MRIHHTMIRVGNLDKSLRYYTKILRMKILAKKNFPEEKFTIAFLGYGKEKDGALIELTYNWEENSYTLGNGFGHIAIEVSNVYKFCEHVKTHGETIIRPPGPKKFGKKIIAFLIDPDGYKIEIYERD